ncbi:hypothetical protein ACJJTC_016946 [Scirpophaga incertulas]
MLHITVVALVFLSSVYSYSVKAQGGIEIGNEIMKSFVNIDEDLVMDQDAKWLVQVLHGSPKLYGKSDITDKNKSLKTKNLFLPQSIPFLDDSAQREDYYMKLLNDMQHEDNNENVAEIYSETKKKRKNYPVKNVIIV